MSARPVIAIIGRPNVGKSSLFNRFLRQRKAIVSPTAGTTRDNVIGTADIGAYTVDIIDTAGLEKELGSDSLGQAMLEQAQRAAQDADLLLFVLDGQFGLTADDQQLAEIIRKAGTPCLVFINKVDSPDQFVDLKLLQLGLGPTVTGSLIHRRGTPLLQEEIEKTLKELDFEPEVGSDKPSELPRVALVGRPNVGKSTLLNSLIGAERVIVSDQPGTTRDSIDTRVDLSDGTSFVLTDTAGLRRRGKIGRAEKIEQYSVVRTIRTINEANLVVLVVDAEEGLTRGDVHVAMHALEQEKAFITVINKSDLIDRTQFNWHRFPFLKKQPMIFVSALNKEGIQELLELIAERLRSLGEKRDQS